MWTLLMQSAHGRTALGRKLKQPWKETLGSRVGGLGDGVWILGGRIPFTSLTPPPGRGHSWRRTRWGHCGHSSCNWTNLSQKAMAKCWRDALGRRWRDSCKQKRAEFMFLLLQAFGQPHTYSGPSGWRWHLKMRDKRIAFQKKTGLQRDYFESKCLERFLFRDYCWYFHMVQHYANYLYKCSKLYTM